MPDAAATTAATSTATEVKNPYADGKLTTEISNAWFSGKDPATPQKKTEDSATSDTSKETQSAPDGKSAAASETATDGKQEKKEGGKEGGADDRIGQLTAKWRDEERKRVQLEKELKDLRDGAAGKEKTTATAKTEPPPVQELKKPVRPKEGDFATWEEYETASDKYVEDLTEYKAQLAIQKDRQERQLEQQLTHTQAQLVEAKKRYSDWDTVGKTAIEAVYADGKPESGAHPAVRDAIGKSAYMTDLLYALGTDKNLSEFITLSRRDPVAAVIKIGAMATLLAPELEKAAKDAGGKKGEKDDKGTGKESSAKTPTEEPQATKEVGTRGTGPGDPTADAVRRAQGKLTPELSSQWIRNAAARRQG